MTEHKKNCTCEKCLAALREEFSDDPLRGTGRSTSLMLKAISDAIWNRGTWVEFIDHWPHEGHAELWEQNLRSLIQALDLRFFVVRRRDDQVFVFSGFRLDDRTIPALPPRRRKAKR